MPFAHIYNFNKVLKSDPCLIPFKVFQLLFFDILKFCILSLFIMLNYVTSISARFKDCSLFSVFWQFSMRQSARNQNPNMSKMSMNKQINPLLWSDLLLSDQPVNWLSLSRWFAHGDWQGLLNGATWSVPSGAKLLISQSGLAHWDTWWISLCATTFALTGHMMSRVPFHNFHPWKGSKHCFHCLGSHSLG